MKIIKNDKKEMFETVKMWTTTHVRCEYKYGENKLIAEYEDEKITFIHDNPLTVAFYAMQLNGFTSQGYRLLFNEIENKKEAKKNKKLSA